MRSKSVFDAGSDDADPGSAILRAVLSLGRRLRAERAPSSVSLAGIGVLSTLDRFGSMPATKLAEEENLAPQSLTRLIASLEAQGCIERHRSEADRRELVISLSSHGRETLTRDMRGRQSWLDEAMATALSADERQKLFGAAKAMLKLARLDRRSRNSSDSDVQL